MNRARPGDPFVQVLAQIHDGVADRRGSISREPVGDGDKRIEDVLGFFARLGKAGSPGLQQIGTQTSRLWRRILRGRVFCIFFREIPDCSQEIRLDLLRQLALGRTKQFLDLGVGVRYLLAERGNCGRARRRIDNVLRDAGAVHDSGKGVVIRGRNGVELVIVAARACHGQAQEGLAENVDLVVHLVGAGFDGVGRAVDDLAEPVKAGAQGRLPV